MSDIVVQLLQRQNMLLEALLQQTVQQNKLVATNKQQTEQQLAKWKERYPDIIKLCEQAAEHVSDVQANFFREVVTEFLDRQDGLKDSSFVLNEFIDRFGLRMAHLQLITNMIMQLGV